MDSGFIVLTLSDVSFTGYPRTCDKGTKSGAECVPPITAAYTCDNEVIDIRNRATYTTFTCPTCLRNIACGVMGKYTRGDCTDAMLARSSSPCYRILQGADGNVYTPPNIDFTFGQMAATYKKTAIDAMSAKPNFHKHRKFVDTPDAQNFAPKNIMGLAEGRTVVVEDASYYEGNCKDNLEHIRIVNETCRLNTVVQYAKCCEQLGRICDLMWSACIEDYCACTDPNLAPDELMTEVACLEEIVHDSMNATCSIDRFYPTATPTSAPTPSPTSGIIGGIPKGRKAEDLIWFYMIFVAVFIVFVVAGIVYWKKKNVGGKVVMDDDEELDMQPTNINTAEATYTHS